jgi:hypothetical protein
MATGFFGMTRFSATIVILACLTCSILLPAHSQSNNRSISTDNGCFPWQDFKNGQCVTRHSQTPVPGPAPAAAEPPTIVAAPPAPPQPPVPPPLPPAPPPPAQVATPPAPPAPVCPASTHYDAASERCVVDAVTSRPNTRIVCDGGSVSNGACRCPAGFELMQTPGTPGGLCARLNAENCLGGELTVSGKCVCDGQVTMSGETYLLEYSNGKCLPMGCPVTALLRSGKCPSSSSAEPEEEPQSRPAPRQTKEAGDDSESRHHCGRGMVYTRSGCAPAHRQAPEEYRRYYQSYFPGIRN